MPIQKFHCALCGHGYGDITMAVHCEQNIHTSIFKDPLNNLESDIVKVEETYEDLIEFPSHIIVTLVDGSTIKYTRTT